MRQITRRAAFEPDSWDIPTAGRVADLFDGLAAEWHTRSSEPRMAPVADAWDRGGPIPAGRWLEVGSGSGLVTWWLAERTDVVIADDLAMEMLRLASPAAGPRLRADASRLPFADRSLDAVWLINALLFPAETARVLTSGGAVIWVNTSGPDTPIYLSADDTHRAMGAGWTGVASEAAFGTWAVLRRA
ncbi:MAG: class I SAM-dependent methyltransferase [Actinomycetota bacterium]|nr:class I SAM-dependent methyltransferase [Actinomycetota bacterium]